MFTVEDLFNPLRGFERDEHGESSSSPLSANSKGSHLELGLLVVSDEEIHSRNYETKATAKKQRKVRFAEAPRVAMIPSHRDHTDEEYFSIWSSPEEIEENANRNRIEFYYESHWKMVLEEDRFVLCSDGELYHPVTVNLHLRRLKQQQERLLKEQKAREHSDEVQRLATRKRKLSLPSKGEGKKVKV